MAAVRKTLVVGGGVIGLTTARALQSKGVKVVVKCAKPSGEVTSGGSGGYWMPFHAEAPSLNRWAEETLARYLVGEDSFCVEAMPAKILYASSTPPSMPAWGAGRAKMRLVAGREAMEKEFEGLDVALPEGYESGWVFETVVVDAPRYCAKLEDLIRRDGGDIEVETVDDLVEEAKRCGADAVVNCAGLNGATLAKDDHFDVVPGRGVVLRYARPSSDKSRLAVVTAHDGPLCASDAEPAYFIPRGDVVVVGGTYDENDFEDAPRDHEVRRIQQVAATYGGTDFQGQDPLAVWVGHRPVRTAGVRVEVHPAQQDGITVAHNYGHGGSGYTIAWGCAEDIADAIVGFRLKKK